MKKKTLRSISIFVFIVVTLYFLAPLFFPGIPGAWGNQKLKLGLDLQGGMQILLDVDTSQLPESEHDSAVKTAIEVIRNRVDQFGVSEPSIQQIGKSRIMVQLPGLKEMNRAKDIVGKTALLEFKLVAEGDQVTIATNALDVYLQQNLGKYKYVSRFENKSDTKTAGNQAAADILKKQEKANPVDKATTAKTDSTNKAASIDSLLAEDTGKIFSNMINSGSENLSIAYDYVPLMTRLLNDPDFQRAVPAGMQIALGKEDKENPKADREVYVLYSNAELTGKYLANAQTRIGSGYDPKTSNKPYVELKFNREGARIFETVTGQNIKKRLAIVLDGVVYVAPVIQDKIPRGEAQITGNFTMAETNDLVIVLKAGNLPAPVSIAEERTVGASLGNDSIHAGMVAGLLGLAIVVLFMIMYYGMSGLIADIALIFNTGFILAMMTAFGATLTMPGIAGMILTIGMAVDANVLIYERIREELRAGKTVRSSVEAGFDRAMVTIIDSNITTLLAAAVLYVFGTGPIRGFAITLSIGIIGSMFSAIVLVKAFFDTFVTNVNRDKLSV